MEIITQFLAGETFNYFISHWRLESMIAIIVFILTYSFMKKKNNEYKKLNEKLLKDMVKIAEYITEIYKILKEMEAEKDLELMKIYAEKAAKSDLTIEEIAKKALSDFRKAIK